MSYTNHKNNQIQKYKASQKNGTQTVGDVAAAAASISSFMVADKFLKKYNTQDKLNALPSSLSKIINNLEESNNKWAKRSIKVHDLLKSKTKATIFMLPLLAIIGGSTKQTITNIDTLCSKEYSINKKDYANKKDYKAAKKAANKAKIDFNSGGYIQDLVTAEDFEKALEKLDNRWERAIKRLKK